MPAAQTIELKHKRLGASFQGEPLALTQPGPRHQPRVSGAAGFGEQALRGACCRAPVRPASARTVGAHRGRGLISSRALRFRGRGSVSASAITWAAPATFQAGGAVSIRPIQRGWLADMAGRSTGAWRMPPAESWG